MHKFLFINSVYFKIHPTGTLGADIKIKIENILGQALRGCKLAWDFHGFQQSLLHSHQLLSVALPSVKKSQLQHCS